jgi:hypothetical protein
MAKKQQEDPAMQRVRTLFSESGLSLVELGRRMGYGDDTARQSAWQFMRTGDPRMSMLRKFAEAMGVTVDQLTLRGKRMTRKLETELEACGCELTRAQFHELLERVRVETCPTRTADDLVCRPDEAKAYCDRVRTEINNTNLADYLILRTLLNARKAR